ncbi:MAG: lactoylglutathione lyase [Candidatus Dactylopiibacterium carminicum]|uniref:Lactoylglutathione lyase n=1 Tax=Candidatus Dactylopiibacterium carminicum TaxID=857335 RepID=A0A272ET89_9RHOO|nr:lactoylglutathione lyase [Candidatus Dactylopiibacterium carminicum]KAF7599183.1 lactoylglutathione lyase [Candidatus Dactylopiibacterium carminicum]PAS93246.1 MAG: lactoylglutathione lyase [Candidatus Dactylopiibacterium carminicum]PAS97119.1 MAG: lactoylglutathione lyase [Candidatus Dactylopiibacterium carminicum]PAS99197.1 MAG: hypothetical protein BSR46_09390 [Candidatus Dactylopiibacterium carminicum]
MNAVNWFEIPVADLERASVFYGRLYATELQRNNDFPGMPMAMLPYVEPGVGGCLVKMDEARPHADGVRVYLNGGDDLATILERVVPAGGKVIVPKTLIHAEIGYFAIFADTEGNLLGLHSMH